MRVQQPYAPVRAPSVAVLVELTRGGRAGGHVKCWERFAEAAAARDPAGLGVDLTVYFLGAHPGVEPLSPAVRLVTLRPVLSTGTPTRLLGGVDVTDVTPYHAALAAHLRTHDVWHLTHAFAFASTAVRLRRRMPQPSIPAMVHSLHTDVPTLTAAYVGQAVDSAPGLRRLLRPLPRAASPESIAAALARRRRDRLLRACDQIMVASTAERSELERVVGRGRVSLLGRGIDLDRFRPDPAARAEFTARYQIPDDEVLVLFAGRVDASKRVLIAAEAIRRLRESGRRVRLVVAGTGAETDRLTALLDDGVTCLGRLPQDRLAGVYAACDLLAFPSDSETIGNVVAEAMACGLPVVLPAGARTTTWLESPGTDGVVVAADDARGWAQEIATLVDRPAWRARIGHHAYVAARHRHRTWDRVLDDDLLPCWRRTTRVHAPG